MNEYILLKDVEEQLNAAIDKAKTQGRYERLRTLEDVIVMCHGISRGKDNGTKNENADN